MNLKKSSKASRLRNNKSNRSMKRTLTITEMANRQLKKKREQMKLHKMKVMQNKKDKHHKPKIQNRNRRQK